VRLFLAIDPGDVCRHYVGNYIEQISAQAAGIRWVKPDKLHITLSFLGEVDASRVESIVEGGRGIGSRHDPIKAVVSGTGVFPTWRRPRVVWLGISDAGALIQLGTDVQHVCASLGFSPDNPFRAHLTIGRVIRPLSRQQRDVLRKSLETPVGPYPFEVTRVSLLQSRLGAAGSVYNEIASFPLGGA
jgi:2'-5' RNA ligase